MRNVSISAICNPEIGSVAATFQIFQTDYSEGNLY
ncbi:hypothetical protein T03_5347 [Trichinella britovi]|uniref:Uncharacterized protein n=1 Tax=Trichinella britovi TaxID=45882 RepID=A0A0V0ZTV4_TRIBR|nr:hypothetical protein T03_5347 [Trichinella britovi]